jgi:hypothetical protein
MLIQIIFNNIVHASKKTAHFITKKLNWLILFKEIIAVCSENHTGPVHTKCTVRIVNAGGTYSYRWVLNS